MISSYSEILNQIEPEWKTDNLNAYLNNKPPQKIVKALQDCVDYKQSTIYFSLESFLISLGISLFIGIPIAEAAYYQALELCSSQLGAISACVGAGVLVMALAFLAAYLYDKNTDKENREYIKKEINDSIHISQLA